MNQQLHLLSATLSAGGKGEKIVEDWLSQFYILKPATKAQQVQGIDFVGVHKISKERTTFEVKADYQAFTTKNAVLELGHWVDGRLHRHGWLQTCQADQFLYLIPQEPLVYILNLPRVRLRLEELQRQYRVVEVLNEYHGLWQTTHNLLIPLWQLARLCEGCVTIQTALPAHYQNRDNKNARLSAS